MLSKLRVLLVSLLCACNIGCQDKQDTSPNISTDSIRQAGELIVLTRNAPTVYYYDREGQAAGFDHDLIRTFADKYQLKPKFIVLNSLEEIFSELEKGNGHIAAAGLTRTAERTGKFLSSKSYQQVTQQVVCRRNGNIPADINELSSLNVEVIANSSYVDQLNTLKQQYPELQWQEASDANTETLLKKVWEKEIDCTIADSNIVAINRRYHPELVVAFDLSQEESLVWYLPRNAKTLRAELTVWLQEFEKSGNIERVHERYYGFAEIFDYVDTRKYVTRIYKRLPQYEPFFRQAAEQYQLPWTLLAAQSYQESHWNRRAKSPTGVRGMMMLTLTTAKEVGVTSRLDAKQSIFGGAKYLARLRKQLPEEIEEPDRTWFALAAYNVGMGHLKDARDLAVMLNKNPNAWTDLQEVLPLLTQKTYYKQLKYGYARGHEPVQYVTRIRDFEDILLQRTTTAAQANKPKATAAPST